MNDGSKEVVLSDEFINTIWIFFKSVRSNALIFIVGSFVNVVIILLLDDISL